MDTICQSGTWCPTRPPLPGSLLDFAQRTPCPGYVGEAAGSGAESAGLSARGCVEQGRALRAGVPPGSKPALGSEAEVLCPASCGDPRFPSPISHLFVSSSPPLFLVGKLVFTASIFLPKLTASICFFFFALKICRFLQLQKTFLKKIFDIYYGLKFFLNVSYKNPYFSPLMVNVPEFWTSNFPSRGDFPTLLVYTQGKVKEAKYGLREG